MTTPQTVPAADNAVAEARARTVTAIADKFAELLRRDLTKKEFAEMKALNETAEFADGCCASQNYLDANMTMDEAMIAVLKRSLVLVDDGDVALWNDSWEDARRRHIGCFVEPKIVREFSPAGPCLTRGRLTGETAKFWCYEDRNGGVVTAKKIAKNLPGRYSRAHVEPCSSCRDHPKTQYPRGYED